MDDRRTVRNLSGLQDILEATINPGEILTNRGLISHIYIKLDFESQFENATNADDARSFLRAVARGATVAESIARRHSGNVLEVQGSTLHVALPSGNPDATFVVDYVQAVHQAFKVLFANPSIINGWRMACDTGFTLVIHDRDVHDDTSFISLGDSANNPAKYLYKELSLPEDERKLQKYHLALCSPAGVWLSRPIDELASGIVEDFSGIGEIARKQDMLVTLRNAGFKSTLITASAAPIQPAGMPGSPTSDLPDTYFGWVMRADLDGFTKRVKECQDDDSKLNELAEQFTKLMSAATQFTHEHSETLAQLPWAGDNYTVAAVFTTRDDYEDAAEKRPIELALDFSEVMDDLAQKVGFGGWAYGIAGGEVHGSAKANIFIGGIEFQGRRMLVGAGEGFGRSFQAFGSVNPAQSQVACFVPDVRKLRDEYKNTFKPARNYDGQVSSLYRIAEINELEESRDEIYTAPRSTVVTSSNGTANTIQVRQHFSQKDSSISKSAFDSFK